MIPIKDNYKIQYGLDYGRPDKENKQLDLKDRDVESLQFQVVIARR